MRLLRVTLPVLVLTLASCSESTSPKTCSANTGAVEPTIRVGQTVQFDWAPSCPAFMVLVEQNGSDQWVIHAPGLGSTLDESANVISPTVTYGQKPSGTEQTSPAEPLVAGQTYTLVLWRVLPTGSTASCMQKVDNACLMAVKEFTR